jgi:sensor domain CHASE-containing protein
MTKTSLLAILAAFSLALAGPVVSAEEQEQAQAQPEQEQVEQVTASEEAASEEMKSEEGETEAQNETEAAAE